MPRSIWNGALSFAGIDVPVKVFGAADPQGVQFRELHEPDGAEIAHELVDADGRKVDRRQVVKGFAVRAGEYVVLDDDELKAASAPKRKTVDIEHFVPREQIDPDTYDRAYWSVAGGTLAARTALALATSGECRAVCHDVERRSYPLLRGEDRRSTTTSPRRPSYSPSPPGAARRSATPGRRGGQSASSALR